jgi:3-methyladenine DNA glycosylase AlkD
LSTRAKLSGFEVLSTAKLLWDKDEREFTYTAVDLLIKHQAKLTVDADISCQSTDVLKRLLTEKSWWDTVDMLASNGMYNIGEEEMLKYMYV